MEEGGLCGCATLLDLVHCPDDQILPASFPCLLRRLPCLGCLTNRLYQKRLAVSYFIFDLISSSLTD